MFDAIGLPTIEMRCVCCKATQQIRIRNDQPHLTRCHACSEYLGVRPSIQHKPNGVLVALEVVAVPFAKPDEIKPGKSAAALKAVG